MKKGPICIDYDVELSYHVNHVAKTGRDGWPWSIRKVGVFQNYDHGRGTSTWIILQPTSAMRRLSLEYSTMPLCRSLAIHSHILRTTLLTWQPYLQNLDAQVRKEVGCRTRILILGIKSPSDTLACRAERHNSICLSKLPRDYRTLTSPFRASKICGICRS
jgi:hypothetical protein